MFAHIGDHFFQSRELVIEIARFLIHPAEPAPDIETIGKFRGRFLQNPCRVARCLGHVRFK